MTTRESETHQTETKQFILEHPTSTHRGEIHLADLKKNWFAKKDTAARLGRDGGKKKTQKFRRRFWGRSAGGRARRGRGVPRKIHRYVRSPRVVLLCHPRHGYPLTLVRVTT